MKNLLIGVFFSTLSLSASAALVRVQTVINGSENYQQERRIENASPTARAEASMAELGASVRSVATLGILKSASEINGRDVSVYGTAEWKDSIVFHNEALTGQAGKFTLNLLFDYKIDASAEGYNSGYVLSEADFQMSIGGKFYRWWPQDREAVYDLNAPQIVSMPIVLEVDFIWGNPSGVHASLSARCSSVWSSTNTACIANAGNSLYWGGVSNVRDATGTIANYSLSAESGFDYDRSLVPTEVPEPASLALLGVGALALMRRRTRK